MRDQVCQLQQAGLLHTCKIGDVGEVVDSSPGRTPLAEVVYPDFGSLVESTFCKYQQSALRIVLLVATLQEDVETFTYLLCSSLDSLFPPKRCVLFDCCGVQQTALIYGIHDHINQFLCYCPACLP